MTDEELAAVDKIIEQHEVCTTPHAEVDLFNEELRASGFIAYANLNLFMHRRPYERSLWVMREDGRCIPELYALATLKHGGPLPFNARALWQDGHPSNNLKENVLIVLQKPEGMDLRVGSIYGVPSSDPLYRKKYLENPKNREKAREASRIFQKKKREELKKSKGELPVEQVQQMKSEILQQRISGTDDDVYFVKLTDPEIIKSIQVQTQMLEQLGTPHIEALRQATEAVLGIVQHVQETQEPTADDLLPLEPEDK